MMRGMMGAASGLGPSMGVGKQMSQTQGNKPSGIFGNAMQKLQGGQMGPGYNPGAGKSDAWRQQYMPQTMGQGQGMQRGFGIAESPQGYGRMGSPIGPGGGFGRALGQMGGMMGGMQKPQEPPPEMQPQPMPEIPQGQQGGIGPQQDMMRRMMMMNRGGY